MRILVLGDSYCPNRTLRPALEGLLGHEVTFVDVTFVHLDTDPPTTEDQGQAMPVENHRADR